MTLIKTFLIWGDSRDGIQIGMFWQVNEDEETWPWKEMEGHGGSLRKIHGKGKAWLGTIIILKIFKQLKMPTIWGTV